MNNQSYQALVNSLEHGWRVQSPVYFRQQWYTAASHKVGYYFILKKDNDTDLIIVPDDEQVRQLIERQHLKVLAS
jgi:hypothetical protein